MELSDLLKLVSVPGLGPVAGGGAWAPSDLASAVFWATADSGVFTDAGKTTPATDTDLVYTWVDQISGADLVQATEGNRPTFNTNQINGLPALTFNATHWLTSTFDLSNGYTAVYVLYTTDGTNAKYVCTSNAALNNFFYILTTEELRIGAGGLIIVFPAGSFPISTPVCCLGEFNGATSNAELNGTAGTPGDAGTTALTDLRIGTTNAGVSGWIGQIAEVIYFSEILSAANKTLLETYISNRYGITFS